MKFLIAALALIGASAARPLKSHKLANVAADSKMGASLLSKARKLEQEEEGEADMTWVAGYSIIFQGCHHVSQWNDEADGEEDVKIQTKRLVRFRLCPTGTCSSNNAGGCNSGYGDYVLDMNEYLDSYLQAVEEQNQWDCENLENNVCACNDDDANQQGDDFDEEKCLYDCYKKYGKEDICADNNPYEDDEAEQEKFELNEYMECQQYDFPEDEERKLEEAEEEEVEYYLGPYCANNGGDIYLGLFTDDACTNFAAEDGTGGSSVYSEMAGETLPYSYETKQSVVAFKCMSCQEPEEDNGDNDNNNNGEEEEVRVSEFCENTYQNSGKCESGLGIDNPNENACNYMEGIKIVRKNGVINSTAGSANKTATVFIGIFVVAFVLLAAYVFYLRTKLDRASINLSE